MRFAERFRSVSREQTKDFGQVLCLAFLLGAYFTGRRWVLQAAILLLLINLVCPAVYRIFARVWFGLSILLGLVMSRVILTLVFVFLVTPVGIVRRLAGFDSLSLKKWKNGSSSVFKVRDHAFGPEDLNRPF
ncbi:MAG: SxtJ family membrane protein [Desulfobacteraceae bacterium]|nr:SxtJ family membrane protein [Desulfobacteraceae bacterium]